MEKLHEHKDVNRKDMKAGPEDFHTTVIRKKRECIKYESTTNL
jgi:hypothetical protein